MIRAGGPTVIVSPLLALMRNQIAMAEQMDTGLAVFRDPLERESLRLDVIAMPNKAKRLAWLAEALPHLDGTGIGVVSTVVYDTTGPIGTINQAQLIDGR